MLLPFCSIAFLILCCYLNLIALMNFHKYTFLHSLSVLTNSLNSVDNISCLIYGNRQLLASHAAYLLFSSFRFIISLFCISLLFYNIGWLVGDRCTSNGLVRSFSFDKALCFASMRFTSDS
jgi:hypothetical protein